VIARILLVIPPTLFWIIRFLPWDGGENWFPVAAWGVFLPLSLLALGPSLYFSIKQKNDIGWWMISAFDFSPLIQTFADFAADIARSQK